MPMPILYETYASPVIQRPPSVRRRGFYTEKEFNLLDSTVASPPLPNHIGFGAFTGGSIRKDTYVDVVWDTKKTVLNQALLRWSAHLWRAVGSISAMEARIYVNDVAVSTRPFYSLDPTCTTKGVSEGVNIGMHLKNGRNKFSFELARSWEVAASGVDGISVRFVAQFTGEEPGVTPPPTTSQQLLTYLKWGIVGAVAIGGVYVGTKAIAEWRKKKK